MQSRYFVFLYRPGPQWLPGKPITEQPLDGHFRYMTQLEADGILVLGGGFLDDSGAMGVLIAPSQHEAEGLVADDPAVRGQVVTATVHPWFITVARPITASSAP